ncbi:MAG: hypothetical protein ACFB00_06455 [Parvularculaceae bacterium]
MVSEPFLALALCVVVYGLASRRLSAGVVSAPMAFMFAGLLVGDAGFRFFDLDVESETLEGFAELTLALILFSDAAATNAGRLALHPLVVPNIGAELQ